MVGWLVGWLVSTLVGWFIHRPAFWHAGESQSQAPRPESGSKLAKLGFCLHWKRNAVPLLPRARPKKVY